MDLMNHYLVEELVRARLAELRADAARMRMLAPRSVDAPGPARSVAAWLTDCARWLVNAPRPRVPFSGSGVQAGSRTAGAISTKQVLKALAPAGDARSATSTLAQPRVS
jgi:hypothetical protein